MRNVKGQFLGGENKGVRLPRVRERADLFAAGYPIECPYHGEHVEWAEYRTSSQPHPNVRCKKCMRAQSKKWVRQNYLHALVMWAKKRDANAEIDEQFLKELLNQQDNRCALTGLPFDDAHKPSIDRRDSSVGYTKTNVQLVLFDINRMKSDLSPDLFLTRCMQVTEHALVSTAS